MSASSKYTASDYAFWLLVTLLTVPIGWLINGWAIATVWGWFAVPFGLPVLTWATATGLSFVAALFQRVPDDATQPHDKPPWHAVVRFVGVAFGRTLIVGFAWVFRAVFM